MDYKEFEAMTAALYQALGEGSGIKIVGYGTTCRVPGKSGNSYQIDVLAEQSNGLQTVRTAIECKYWKSKVNRDVVSKLVAIIKDTDIDKGAIFSKEGFTSGAINLARHENIGLVEMREPNDADWEGKIKTLRIMVNLIIPEFYDLEFIQNTPATGEKVSGTASTAEITIKEPGKEAKTLARVINEACEASVPPHEMNEVKFPSGTTLHSPGFDKHAIINAIRFKVKYKTYEDEIVIDGTEAIRLIVKELLEDRQFNVDHKGKIIETTTSADPAIP